jgi:hypothetical protein
MKLIDLTSRFTFPAFGVGVRWLREELQTRGVSVRLTEACLREFAADAASAATRGAPVGDALEPYAARLRHELALRAEFVRAWTRSDDTLDVRDPSVRHLTSIARKFALPRAWTLSEPTASECRHPTPTYLNWASAS